MMMMMMIVIIIIIIQAGYHIKQVGPYSFTCQKLGQILVYIKDGKEHGEVFPSVLLSLSGEDGYRNNSISGPGGAFKFDNLFPGSFYLRPLLKVLNFPLFIVKILFNESWSILEYAG